MLVGMSGGERLVDKAVTIFSLVREYVQTDPTYRPAGEMIQRRSSESSTRHTDLAQDLLDEISEWEGRVREARSNGSLPPNAADSD
jgi:hypothetical protein